MPICYNGYMVNNYNKTNGTEPLQMALVELETTNFDKNFTYLKWYIAGVSTMQSIFVE